MKRVVVIGGGISGLAAAHKLLERALGSREPLAVTVLEAGPRAGGIIQTEQRDGFLLEHGPDAFITEKPQAIDLARRLGLESCFLQTNEEHRRSFIVNKNRLLPIPTGFGLIAPSRLWPFATSDILSWPGKARMALDLFMPRRQLNGDDDESLASFVQRRLGREALERLAQPMIGGIYTADPDTLSLRATMPRFLDMERKYRSVILGLRADKVTDDASTSGARYGLFLTFNQGMQLLVDRLVERIIHHNQQSVETTINLNTRVLALKVQESRWTIETRAGAFEADAVCLALPSFASAELLSSIDAAVSSELAAIPYSSSATINIAYKREDISHALDGFGFVVPFVEKRTVMACTFSSVKFAGRAPNGYVLLRVFVGGALQPELVELDDAELLPRVRDDLRDLLGIKSDPVFEEASRWRQSMPQYLVGHLKRVERIEKSVASNRGFALAGNAFSGVGIPDCIRSGEAAAEKLLTDLHKTH